MKQLLTGKQMKQADTWSIKEFGMESLILMERAALCAAQSTSCQCKNQMRLYYVRHGE